MFNNIPDELKRLNQWVCWRLEDMQEGKATKVPYCPHNGALASVTNPATWGSFESAVANSVHCSGIGFVLTASDPYSVIDLDDPYEVNKEGKPKFDNPQEILDRQLKVFHEFNSYSEISPSGKGLHIWVKGNVPSGRKRSNIEVYSSVRYMTFTGNVYKNEPIKEKHEILNILWEQIGGSVACYTYEGEEKFSDNDVLEMASKAVNGEKFMALLNGKFEDYYPSQSEADFAFINIVAFYTQNRFQITRIFRASALGQRPKALRADYTNWMINKSFDRMLPLVDLEGLKNQMQAAISAKTEDCTKNRLPNLPPEASKSSSPGFTLPQISDNNPYTVPPGLVGELAQFIHAQAPRPVPEIALAGAIGLMAGICGRAYNVSGTGLNQYVLLLAPTGTGKEAIAGGIDKLIATVQRTVPAAVEFIGPAEIASPQALAKYMSKTSPCFVSLVGEFGLKLQEMSAWNANSNQIALRRMLLDLYNKSGEGKVLRPTIYSESMKNTEPVLAPAFTMLGESTPEEFYKILSEGMIASGLLPRFTTIEYHGKRPPLNPAHAQAVPSFQLIEQLSTLCAHCLMLSASNKSIHVEMNVEAKKQFDEFDLFCDAQINGAQNEVMRHLWNRGHIKAMKLAALIAVGNNPYNPTITAIESSWALNLVVQDVKNLLQRFENGEVGVETAETKQLADMKKVIKDYLKPDANELQHKYKIIVPQMQYDGIIQYKYIQARLVAVAAFRLDKIGSTKAIQRTIENLIAFGEIQEVPASQLQSKYSTKQKAYVVVNPAGFL